MNFTLGFGQGVTISSDGDEGPVFTQQQTIPLTFEFEEPINGFEEGDINTDNGDLTDFIVDPPNYKRLDSVDLSNFFLFQFEKIIISIDVNSNDEVFILTQGEGVKQLVNGELEDFIDAEFLTAPYDLAISNDDKIYIADNGTYEDENDNRIQDRRVKVFDENGNPLFDEYLGEGRRGGGKDQFYGPIGLAFDEFNNLYVADYYDGTDSGVTEPSRIKIYYDNGQFDEFFGSGDNKLKSPYRLAVNNEILYIADLGDNEGNGRVQYFDVSTFQNEIFLDVLEDENLKSPGSIVIDDYGFIYVADFGENINLSDILTIDPAQASIVFNSIKAGIDANGEIFNIDVFDKNNNYRISIKNEVDLPVDLALNNCSSLLVHNTVFSGSNVIAAQVDVDIEYYNRLPHSFTANLEITDECIPAEASVGANVGEDAECNNTPANGDTFIATWDQTKPVRDICIEDDITVPSGFVIPNYIENGEVSFNDNCGVENLTYSQTPEVGETITQTTTVSISATDETGNISEACTFDLVVEEELFIDCSDDQTEDFQGECEFELPDYTDDANFTLGAKVTQFPEEGTFITENTEITLTAELDGETRECTFIVEATNQRPALAISCPGDQTEDADANDIFEIPDYTNLANVANSCGNINVTQSPVSGTEIDENTTIILSAVDDRGVSVDCSFEVILNFQEKLFIDCPDDQTEDFQGECEFELPDYTDDANFTSGATVTQFPEEGTFITENTEITLTAELDGETRECTFIVEATNQRPALAISCPGDQTEDANANDTFEIPDYTNLANLANSCGNINVTQSPVAGTVVDENTTVILSAVDDRGVSVDCNFEVILNFTDPSAPEIECINQEIFLDEDGQAILDVNKVYNGERDDLELSLSQENFDCSNLGANTVTLTATDPVTGLSSNCSAGVEVIDPIFPEANCVAPGREFRLQNGSVTISPSAIDLNSEDNCEIARRLSEDTFTTPGIKNITLFVEDAAGNTDECATSIEILAEDDQSTEPGYTCFEGDIPDLRLDENCEINVIPDYSYLVETENFTPRFEQTEERFGETLVVTLEVINAEDNNLVGECTFSINIVDLLPPNISCPGDQTENFDPETGFEVPNYESWATFSDNCGEVSFRQEPEAGEIIYQDTTVQLFAEDANEQVASCSFELQLTEANVLNIFCQIDQNVSPDEDCSFTLPDYTDTAEVSLPGATITQSPPEGTVINENTQVKLTATLNGETDECFFMVNLVDNENPVANCVSGYVVNLDESGNATLAPEMLDNNSTDNCGIVSMALSQINFTRADIGEVPITLTVRDDAGNMDTCETTVEVVDENSGEFECRENVVVSLNENGEAMLSLQELYTGNASGLTLEASRLNFSCSDLGMVQIQLDYSGAQTGSCSINVEVRDEIPPFINTDVVELTLGDEGFAYLEEDDVLAENNCGQQFIYRFSKSVFNCEDVGLNTVNVEVEDANGNIAEKNIEVRVNGEACEIPDNEDLEFLFIYPNPNNGTFTIATPEGMQVEQVRVFDSRGRFILQKEYKDIARFYRMTIEGVESSVYTLQIFTNEGVVVKRVIISQ
ncbi:hypothetical protein GCM10008086_12020 [Salegentibacter mishustinae]|nr:hypothetical protein GCM10008086_12020 [Salegentibacter mishustinae]